MKSDKNNVSIPTYNNEHIMSFARSWTGFDLHPKRGNTEESGWSGNRIDPMRIVPDWRDKFPKVSFCYYNYTLFVLVQCIFQLTEKTGVVWTPNFYLFSVISLILMEDILATDFLFALICQK